MWNPWNYLLAFTSFSAILMMLGISASYHNNRRRATAFMSGGTALQLLFIIWLWIYRGYTPLHTMGEMRLWSALFLFLAGTAVYRKYNYRSLPIFTTLLGTALNTISIACAEYQVLPPMPVFRSVWFAPHMAICILAYAILCCATMLCCTNLIKTDIGRDLATIRLTRMGTGLFGIGLLLGAVWAGQASGSYWSWHTNETWAAIAWLLYLLFVHLRINDTRRKLSYIIAIAACAALQISLWAVTLLPV